MADTAPPLDDAPTERILVATDGSPSAEDAVDFAIELARDHGAELVIGHAAPVLDVFGWSEEVTATLPHDPTEADLGPLRRAEERARGRGVRATTKLLPGSPAEAIVAQAETDDVALIVVGSRGHGVLGRALLGSVSLRVLRHATRPVVVVRGREAALRGREALAPHPPG